MQFKEEEIFYLKKILFNHSLVLTDIIMNEKDQRDLSREVLKINASCMDKIRDLESKLGFNIDL